MNKTEYYNQFYKNQDWKNNSLLVKFKLKAYLKIVSSIYDKNIRTIVDAGCGTGLHSHILKSLKYEISGFDFSETAILKAKKRFDKIDFRILNGNSLNYNPNIDCFLALGFSEFNSIDFPKTTHLIEYWRTFLSSRGIIFISLKTDFSQKSPSGWYFHSENDLKNIYLGDKMKKQIIYIFPPFWTLILLLPKSKTLVDIISILSKQIFAILLRKPITALIILQNGS